MVLILFTMFSIGVYYGYQKYNFDKEQQFSANLTKNSKSNPIDKNSIDEESQKAIIDKVTRSENSKTEADIESAKKAVSTLPPGAAKEALNKRINAIVVNKNDTTDFITNAEYVEELFSNTLYVETKDSSKVKGVTVAGLKLELDERYIIENEKVKIVFKKRTPKDSIGKVVINTDELDYEVKSDMIR